MAAGEVPRSIKASIYIDGKLAEGTLKDLKKNVTDLRRELDLLTPGTEAFNQKMQQLQLGQAQLTSIRNEITETSGAFEMLRGEIEKIGYLAAGYLGFQFITDQFHNVITSNAKLSDSLADIRKVTGLSEAAVQRLQVSLKAIDTRTSRAELNELAIVAGKLGISAEDDVLGFVKAANQISVALGKTLGNSEEAVNSLGKIVEIFKVKDTYGLENSLLKAGSAINDLGNAGTANEAYIVEFTKRLGGIAPQANISLQNILGLAAVFDELGQPVEASATAIGKFIVSMGEDIPRFATIAKMSVKDFATLLQKDGNAALISVLKNSQSTGEGISGLAANMGMMGEEGARAISALGVLANNIPKLTERQDLANKSFEKGTSLTEAYALKNENFAGTVEKLSKSFNSLTSNSSVTGFFTKLISVTVSVVDWLNKSMATITMLIKTLFLAGIAYASYNAILGITALMQKNWIAALLQTEIVTKLVILAETSLAATKLLLTGRIREARAAMLGLNAILEVNPWVLLATAVITVVSALIMFKTEVTDAAKAQELFNKIQDTANANTIQEKEKITALLNILKKENESRSDKLKAIARLRELMPDHLKGYSDEQVLAGKATDAIQKYIKALEAKATAEAAIQELTELKKQQAKLERDGSELDTKESAYGYLLDATQAAGAGGGYTKNLKQEKTKRELASNKAQQKALTEKYAQQIHDLTIGDTTQSSDTKNAKGAADETLEALKLKLKGLQDQIAFVKTGTADYFKLYKEIVETEKRIKALTPSTSEDHKAENLAAQRLKELKTLAQERKQFEAARIAEQAATNDKEIKQEENKYDALIDKEKAYLAKKGLTPKEKIVTKDNIHELEAEKELAVNKIRIKQAEEYTKRIEELRISLSGRQATELQKETDFINKRYDDEDARIRGNKSLEDLSAQDKAGIAINEQNREQDLTNAKLHERKRFEDEAAALENEGIENSKNKDQLAIARINQRYDKQIASLKLRYSKEFQLTKEFQARINKLNKQRDAEIVDSGKDLQHKILNAAIDAAQSAANATFTIAANNRHAETDAAIAALEKQKDAELETKGKTESQKKAINEKYAQEEAALKLKAWEADREAAIAQAVINGALAITKTFAEYGFTTAGWIAAAAQAVATAAEIAVIQNQKAPQFAEGGYSDEDPAGYVGQPTVFRKSATGRPFMAGEAGAEWIAPSWMLKNPRTANVIGMLEAARQEKRAFAMGGFTDVDPGKPRQPMLPGNQTAYDAGRLDRIESILHNFIDKQAKINAIPVTRSYRVEQEENARLEVIKKDGTL